jgi:hypothetical protein
MISRFQKDWSLPISTEYWFLSGRLKHGEKDFLERNYSLTLEA